MEWFPAPAKLNLFLHVLGRRSDGYHLLQTVFQLIDWHDEVGIELDAQGRLERVDRNSGADDSSDLCMRAARLLAAFATEQLGRSGGSLGARIALRKQLPIGAGLGGGSSDAATVLIVLNRLWGLQLGRAALSGVAIQLGADVPFFLCGRNAIGEGIGEMLTPIDLPPSWYLVLIPPVSVPTARIFNHPKLTRDTKAIKILPFFQGLGRNDLEAVVCAESPEVAAHLSWLKKHVADARMTGSGSCVFAPMPDRVEAEAVLVQLPHGMRGRVVQGLDRHPLQDWLKEN